MLLSRSTAAPIRSSDFTIRIDDNKDRIITGMVEHCSTGDYAHFRGLLNLVETIHTGLMNFPFLRQLWLFEAGICLPLLQIL